MQQATKIKRINGIAAQDILKDFYREEARGNRPVVGGGAGSGLGPGHLATTLTSFNVSAIANPMSIDSPHECDERTQNDDISQIEKQEIY